MNDDLVPTPPVVLAWTRAYAVVTLGIEGADVRYVPERGSAKPGVSDFDAWQASPYTQAIERRMAALQEQLLKAQQAATAAEVISDVMLADCRRQCAKQLEQLKGNQS